MNDTVDMNTVTLEASSLLDHLPTDTNTDTDGSVGDAVELDISDRVKAYHYDDEPDTVVLSAGVDDPIAGTYDEAHTLTADILDALEALATERNQ